MKNRSAAVLKASRNIFDSAVAGLRHSRGPFVPQALPLIAQLSFIAPTDKIG